MLLILITGSNGRLGRELIKVFPTALAPGHSELRIEDFDQVGAFLKENREVTMIIHSAAMTSTEGCEENPRRAFDVNAMGTNNLSFWAQRLLTNCRFAFISTCVFNGEQGNYIETDEPSPVNVYQFTKAVAEKTIQYRLKNQVIIRTNFIARDPWPYQSAFSDRYANYLFADEVALAIKEVVESHIEGVVHVGGSKKLSMYEAARMTTLEVKKRTLSNYKGPRLPRDMSLKSIRWKTYDM